MNIDDFVFSDIRRYHLHKLDITTHIISYSNAIEWTIEHTDIENRIVINDEGKCIALFQPYKLEKYYILHQPKKYMITRIVEQFH